MGIAGVLLTVFAMWGASELHRMAIEGAPIIGAVSVSALSTIGLVALVVGAVFLVGFLANFVADDDMGGFDSVTSMMYASLTLICFSFLFGAIIAPIGSSKAGLDVWVSPWSFLLIVGLLPMIFVVKGLIADILTRTWGG